MKQRLEYLDWAKGFAILLMLYGHTSGEWDFSQIWVYSFHMPIFFIIGGYIFAVKSATQSFELLHFRSFVIKQFRHLFGPYFVWGVFYCCFFAVLSFVSEGVFSAFEKFSHLIFMTFTMRDCTSLWVIPCYAFSVILLYFIVSILQNSKGFKLRFLLFTFVLAVLFFLLEGFSYYQRFCLSAFFTSVGFCLRYFQFFDRISLPLLIILLFLGSILSQINGPVSIAQGNYGILYVYLIVALTISVAIIGIFRRLEEFGMYTSFVNFLAYFGKNTIVLLCSNNLLVELLHLLDHWLINDYFMSEGYLPRLVFLALLILAELPLIKCTHGKFGLLFGK